LRRHIHKRVRITRDVRYADEHERNVLDIYKPHPAVPPSPLEQLPTLLFVHGGMWMRGSKEQSVLSPWDVAYSTLSGLFGHVGNRIQYHDNSNKNQPGTSNIGVTMAAHGVTALVMNYRLAGGKYMTSTIDAEGWTDGQKQVMDVARSIAFSVEHVAKQQQTGYYSNKRPNLYVCGHSAGAHLAAVALCHQNYLEMAMKERNVDMNTLGGLLGGFIGISGVYNLRRLGMGAMKEITVGPSFLHAHAAPTKEDDEDTLIQFSPVHLLLQNHTDIESPKRCHLLRDKIPPMANIATLLLNAESDFHLEQDAKELMVALRQYKMNGSAPQVDHEMITSSDHLSIISQVGSDIEQVKASYDSVYLTKKRASLGWGLGSMTGSEYPNVVLESVASVFGLDGANKDSTSRRILEFIEDTQ